MFIFIVLLESFLGLNNRREKFLKDIFYFMFYIILNIVKKFYFIYFKMFFKYKLLNDVGFVI